MEANGEMLRLARQLRGFRQIEAARQLNVEQPLLSRVENGLSSAQDDFLLRASKVYEVPESFFFLNDPVLGAPVSVHPPMWRRKADITARDLDAVVSELNVRIIHLRRFLEGIELAHSANIPKLDIDDYESPDEIAAIVRAHWRVPRGPIRDLTALAEQAGALVWHSSLGGASISGVTFRAAGVPPLIILNSNMPADRMRFTLAHELGHLVMHRFPTPDMEREANEFASALLMPAADIKPYFRGKKVDLSLLASMKPEWRVAMQAILMRATSLNAITKNQAQYLWKQISAKKMRLREPPELDFPHEEPTVIPTIVNMHRTALGYTPAELAKLLHVRERDLRSMYPIETPDETPATPRPKFIIMK